MSSDGVVDIFEKPGVPYSASADLYSASMIGAPLPTIETESLVNYPCGGGGPSTAPLVVTFDTGNPVVVPVSFEPNVAITPINVAASFSGGPSPKAYSVFSGTLPVGLALHGTTGLVSGTPTTPGNSSVVFRATDNAGNHANSNSVLFTVAAAGDPYWSSVQLLVQDGVNASTSQVNLGAAGGTAVMTSGGVWTNAQQLFGKNRIAVTQNWPNINPFTSLNANSAYTRPAGMSFTIEAWIRYAALQSGSNAPLFDWEAPGARLGTIYAPNASGSIIWASAAHSSTIIGSIALNTDNFLQVTCDVDALTIDLNGVQVFSNPAMGVSNGAGTYSMYVNGLNTTSGAAISIFGTPFRFTRGIARPRGSVPTEAFPTS